eukprot:jgi/Undpi1/5540/HiC_scaffold_2.g00817.m1
MRAVIATLVGSLVASEAFVTPAVVSRASTAGTSAARRVLTCSASSTGGQQSRASYLKTVGLATAATVASVAAPSIVLAEGTSAGGDDEVKIGEEVTTGSGLKYVVTVAGKGTKPTAGQTIKAHYTGWLNGFGEDGIKFDSSRDRGRPFSFKVGTGQVIKAWDEALLDMKIGERRQITVPPQLGYGSRGAGGIIPGNATLFFDVELLAVQP